MSTPKLIPTSFTRYELTDEHKKLALLALTELQLCFIQNLISEAAEEKLALTVTANDIPSFLQEEAQLQGNIKILQYILTLRDSYLQEQINIINSGEET